MSSTVGTRRTSPCLSGRANPSSRLLVDPHTCSRSICPTPVPSNTASPGRIPCRGRSTCNSNQGSASSPTFPDRRTPGQAPRLLFPRESGVAHLLDGVHPVRIPHRLVVVRHRYRGQIFLRELVPWHVSNVNPVGSRVQYQRGQWHQAHHALWDSSSGSRLGWPLGDIVGFSVRFCINVTYGFSMGILVGFSDGDFSGDVLWKQHTILVRHKLESGSVHNHVAAGGPILRGCTGEF